MSVTAERIASPVEAGSAKSPVAWLDYQLKSNADAAKWFVGSDCRLCKEQAWSVEKKGMQ
jgi:hypothetical protein